MFGAVVYYIWRECSYIRQNIPEKPSPRHENAYRCYLCATGNYRRGRCGTRAPCTSNTIPGKNRQVPERRVHQTKYQEKTDREKQELPLFCVFFFFVIIARAWHSLLGSYSFFPFLALFLLVTSTSFIYSLLAVRHFVSFSPSFFPLSLPSI